MLQCYLALVYVMSYQLVTAHESCMVYGRSRGSPAPARRITLPPDLEECLEQAESFDLVDCKEYPECAEAHLGLEGGLGLDLVTRPVRTFLPSSPSSPDIEGAESSDIRRGSPLLCRCRAIP